MNTIVKSNQLKMLVDRIDHLVDSTTNFKKGDLLVFDNSTSKVKAISSESESINLIGISQVEVVNGKTKSAYLGTSVDDAQGGVGIVGAAFGVVAKLKLKSGESLNPGDLVYSDPSIDAQTVKASGATGAEPIGIYWGNAITSTSNNTEIEVLIGARYPDNKIKF